MANDNLGIAQFYYGRQLPARSVVIAEIAAKPATPADLVDINNSVLDTPRGPGALTITPYQSGGRQVLAPDLNVAVPFQGATQYTIENQFFEMTGVVGYDGAPLFYQHAFDIAGVENVGITDLDRNAVSAFLLAGDSVYHSLDGKPYWVRYYADGILRTELLRYQPVMTRSAAASAACYVFTPGGLVTVFTPGTYWIRFTRSNGYQALPPYAVPANDPWYPVVRFNLRPVAKEWARQIFSPMQPYILATWVPGTILSSNLVEFERRPAYFDGVTYPDILVYDKNYQIKYALDGSDPSGRVDKGFLFPWMRSQFIGIDAAHARCHVNVELAMDDIAFAFYNYEERDIVFRDLDINPFTNPQLKDKVIEFYYADRGNGVPPREGNTHP